MESQETQRLEQFFVNCATRAIHPQDLISKPSSKLQKNGVEFCGRPAIFTTCRILHMRYQTAQITFDFYGIRMQDLAKLASWRNADEENFQEYEDAIDHANINESWQGAQTFCRSLEQYIE
jgi:hypothetical protein